MQQLMWVLCGRQVEKFVVMFSCCVAEVAKSATNNGGDDNRGRDGGDDSGDNRGGDGNSGDDDGGRGRRSKSPSPSPKGSPSPGMAESPDVDGWGRYGRNPPSSGQQNNVGGEQMVRIHASLYVIPCSLEACTVLDAYNSICCNVMGKKRLLLDA